MKRLILPHSEPIWENDEIVSYKTYEEAEKIVKNGNDIIGYDNNNKEVFSRIGISNINLFTLDNGEEWDVPIPTIPEIQQQTLQNKNDNSYLAEIVTDLLLWKLTMEV